VLFCFVFCLCWSVLVLRLLVICYPRVYHFDVFFPLIIFPGKLFDVLRMVLLFAAFA